MVLWVQTERTLQEMQELPHKKKTSPLSKYTNLGLCCHGNPLMEFHHQSNLCRVVGGHAHTLWWLAAHGLHVPCGWLPAPSLPSFYLLPVSYRRFSDGDLFLAASPSLAPFSVAGREETGKRNYTKETSLLFSKLSPAKSCRKGVRSREWMWLILTNTWLLGPDVMWCSNSNISVTVSYVRQTEILIYAQITETMIFLSEEIMVSELGEKHKSIQLLIIDSLSAKSRRRTEMLVWSKR